MVWGGERKEKREGNRARDRGRDGKTKEKGKVKRAERERERNFFLLPPSGAKLFSHFFLLVFQLSRASQNISTTLALITATFSPTSPLSVQYENEITKLCLV
jgi:hypothetical protein